MDSFYFDLSSSNVLPYSEVDAQDQGVGSRNSFALTLDLTGNIASYGTVNDGHGMVSAQALGIACAEQAPADSPPQPGQSGCGKPINIGVGNMYEWKQDYSTVGQNPLFFTRYYNSMAMPDTYAVALGSNWRHNFDRYLHIINPSAIYGAIAERADRAVCQLFFQLGRLLDQQRP